MGQLTIGNKDSTSDECMKIVGFRVVKIDNSAGWLELSWRCWATNRAASLRVRVRSVRTVAGLGENAVGEASGPN